MTFQRTQELDQVNVIVGGLVSYLEILTEPQPGSSVNIAHWVRNHRVRLTIHRGADSRSWVPDNITWEERTFRPPGTGTPPVDESLARYTLSQADRTWLEAPADGDAVRIVLEPVAPRYVAGAVVEYGDSLAAVETDLDFAWAGHVTTHGHRAFYEPGVYAAATTNLGADDVLETAEFYASPDLRDRINALQVGLPAAAEHDWQEGSVRFEDATARTADGVALSRKLPDARFVCDVAGCRRLAEVTLRQLRLFRGAGYTLRAGDALESLALRPGMSVTLSDPERGLTGKRWRVTRTKINPDLTVSIFVRDDPSDLFDDPGAVAVEADAPPEASFVIPVPTGVTPETRIEFGQDGGQTVFMVLSWDFVPFATEIRTRLFSASLPNPWEHAATTEGRLGVPATVGNRFEFQLRHLDRAGRTGEWTVAGGIHDGRGGGSGGPHRGHGGRGCGSGVGRHRGNDNEGRVGRAGGIPHPGSSAAHPMRRTAWQ